MQNAQGEVLVLDRGLAIMAIPETEMDRECQYCGNIIPAGQEGCENGCC